MLAMYLWTIQFNCFAFDKSLRSTISVPKSKFPNALVCGRLNALDMCVWDMEIQFYDMNLVLGHAWWTAHATVSHSIAFRTTINGTKCENREQTNAHRCDAIVATAVDMACVDLYCSEHWAIFLSVGIFFVHIDETAASLIRPSTHSYVSHFYHMNGECSSHTNVRTFRRPSSALNLRLYACFWHNNNNLRELNPKHS